MKSPIRETEIRSVLNTFLEPALMLHNVLWGAESRWVTSACLSGRTEHPYCCDCFHETGELRYVVVQGDLVEFELSPFLCSPCSVWQNFSGWKQVFCCCCCCFHIYFIWKIETNHARTYMQMILSWTALARSVWLYLDCCLWPWRSMILFASANASCWRLLSLIRLKAQLDK